MAFHRALGLRTGRATPSTARPSTAACWPGSWATTSAWIFSAALRRKRPRRASPCTARARSRRYAIQAAGESLTATRAFPDRADRVRAAARTARPRGPHPRDPWRAWRRSTGRSAGRSTSRSARRFSKRASRSSARRPRAPRSSKASSATTITCARAPSSNGPWPAHRWRHRRSARVQRRPGLRRLHHAPDGSRARRRVLRRLLARPRAWRSGTSGSRPIFRGSESGKRTTAAPTLPWNGQIADPRHGVRRLADARNAPPDDRTRPTLRRPRVSLAARRKAASKRSIGP